MKQNYLFKSLFLLFALVVGSVNVWADYEKVTSTNDLTSGDYLIVYEAGNVAFDGALEGLDVTDNTVEVVIADGKIASSTKVDAAVFTIDIENGTVKSASGKYIGVTSNSNGLKTSDDASAYSHSFSIDDDGNAVIAAVFGGSTMTMRYNSASNQNRFRYYKSGQQPVQLYKKVTSNPSDTRIATTVTIDASGITNTNVFAGTAAGKLTATVKAGTEVITSANVTWSSNNEAVATIDNDGVVTLVAAGTAKLTASYAGETDVYKSSSAEYTLTVTNTDPDANDGSAEKPFTVAEAIAFIDAGVGLSEIYHVKGIISQVDSYNSTYSSITYWISDDGTTTNQLEVYSGKGIDGADFASVDDLKVNDNVVIKGKLKYYSAQSVYEFDYNNELVSLDRPTDARTEVTLSFTNADYEAVVGEDFTSPVVSVDPIEYDGTITWKSSKESVATVDADGVVTILAAGTTTITATAPATENFKSATASYVLTVTAPEPAPGEIANPYHYEFTEKQFAEAGAKTLANVEWTLATDAGYFGYDGTKGQQFGSSKAAATSLTLSTSQILGTITKVTVNTSGASSIDATFGVSVGGKAFTCDSEETASLTSTATSYSFVGSASGTIVISYTQTSSKAIYIKSIDVEYTAETVGIQAVNRQHANGEFFNLAGQRVAQPAKGLYIVNGKKVVVK